MSLYEVVKKILADKGISVYRMEKDLNFANGSIRKWDKQIPNAVRLQKVANYLGVTTAYILDEAKKEGE